MLEGAEQAFGDQLRSRSQGELFGDHDELIAAEPPKCVDVAHDALKARRDRTEQFIADAVAERVVDALEVVDIDEERSHWRSVTTRTREHLLDAVEDQGPVG